MCAKKDNYFETLTWIEETIESCNTIEDETTARKMVRTFENTLLKDENINSYVFNHFINRLHNKINDRYDIILKGYNSKMF